MMTLTPSERRGLETIAIITYAYTDGTPSQKQRTDVNGFPNIKLATVVLFLNMQNFHMFKVKKSLFSDDVHYEIW